jgi:hypothetical protein
MIVFGINTVDGTGIKVIRTIDIDKRMLRPVAQHHYQTGKKERYNEDNQGGL